MFYLPTLKELGERMRNSFRANLMGTDAWLWPNNVYVSAKVMAGGFFEVFRYLAYIEKSMHAHTAPDVDALGRHGTEYNIPRKPAAPASGTVTFTVTGDAVVNTNALLRRTDGVEYLVTEGATRGTSGALTVPVVAVKAGLEGNAETNTPLEIVSGVTSTNQIKPTAAVGVATITLGVDVEDIESWRARILFRKRNPPHGGAAADYVGWAGEVSGVSFYLDRATVFVERQNAGPGTLRVFPLMYDIHANGIPSASDIERVRQHIEPLRPAGAVVTYAAPTPVVVPIVISGVEPNTTEVQNAIKKELANAFFRLSRPAGTDDLFGSMPYLASPFSFSRSWIWQAVANATGEQRHSIVQPAADIELDPGEMAVLGAISFVG